MAVVRVHADRVHDAVRRLGCSPAASADVVEVSALDLVDAAASGRLDDPLGSWFARARELAAHAHTDAEVPTGEGVLAGDRDQELLSTALDSRPEAERLALLLRDSYDLPAESVGTVLRTDADGAMALVGTARLRFLPAIDDQPVHRLAAHVTEPAALARLAEGGPVAARDATARRHAQACTGCRAVVEAQDYAHRLLTGLVVVALSESDREALLASVGRAAARLLPSAASLAVVPDVEDDEDDLPRRLLTPLGALLGLVLATALGLGLGLLLVRSPGGIDPALAAGELSTPVTAVPAPTVPAPPADQVQRARTPPPAETRVFTVAPRTTAPAPPPEPSPSPSPEAADDTLGITLDPSSGPNGQTLTVSGTGWTPGQQVTLTYLDPVGAPTGSSATAVPDLRGRFTATLAAQDPQNLPGEHSVQAADGASQTSASYTATG